MFSILQSAQTFWAQLRTDMHRESFDFVDKAFIPTAFKSIHVALENARLMGVDGFMNLVQTHSTVPLLPYHVGVIATDHPFHQEILKENFPNRDRLYPGYLIASYGMTLDRMNMKTPLTIFPQSYLLVGFQDAAKLEKERVARFDAQQGGTLDLTQTPLQVLVQTDENAAPPVASYAPLTLQVPASGPLARLPKGSWNIHDLFPQWTQTAMLAQGRRTMLAATEHLVDLGYLPEDKGQIIKRHIKQIGPAPR